MHKLLITLILSLVLASCGSSDTETTESSDTSSSSGDAGAGDTGDTTDNEDLALTCSKQPATTVNSGNAAKATFSFNKAINTTGVITMSCSNNGAAFVEQNINVISGQSLSQQTVPAACEEANFTIKLEVDNDDVDEALTASCTWPVNKTLGFS